MFRILTIVVVLLAAGPAVAQDADKPDTEGGRYVLRRVDDGLMRLDKATGATSFCRKRGDSWVCEAVADDRVALEDEIARLSEDNAELAREIGRLKDRIAALKEGSDRPSGEDGKTDKEKSKSESPTDEELDKVMRTFETVMRRFMDMAKELREEYGEQDRF